MKSVRLPSIATEKRGIAFACLGLVGLCFLAFFNQLGTLGLMDKTEGLFAEVPRQMLLQHDWVTPRWNGQTFFDYPIWGYWMVALSFRIFGVTEWAARLPAALAASLTVLALFGVVFKLGSESEPIRQRLGRATLAGSLLALSPGWIAWGRSSVTDMFLASAITVALLGFLLVYQAGFSTPSQQSRNQERLGYGCMALFSAIAVLAKGPVGLLLPGLVILLFLVLKGELLSQIRKTPWLPMAALFLGVTLPWYCQATVANGFDFISRFIGYSNFQRFTSVIYSHPGPPWFYIPWVFLFLLPWSLYLPVAVIRLRFWKLLTWRQSSFTADPSLFGLVWLVCMVAFYSAAATKLAGYILPVVPAGVLIVSLLFQPISGQRPLGLGMGISGWFNVLILALTAIASAVFPKFLRHNPDYPFFATALIHSGLQLWLPLIFGLTVVGLVWILLRPQAMPLVWLPNATALSVLLAFAVPALLPLIDRQRLQPIRSIGAVAGELLQSGDVLAVVGFKRYSLLYYSNRPALFVTTRDELFEAIPDHKAVKNIFLFGTDRELHRFGLNPSQCRSTGCQIVARRDAHLLIRTSLADFPKGS